MDRDISKIISIFYKEMATFYREIF
jgi:hypothetical protein